MRTCLLCTTASFAQTASSPGQVLSTNVLKRSLISLMICIWRGSSAFISFSSQHSSASGISVWLVYANVLLVIAHASSQLI
ncbi:hypothetical protein D3C81_2040110 [compost metagenome]